ncbi:LacI family DNA-binding transcriptional regulator [Nocardiopsis composta]
MRKTRTRSVSGNPTLSDVAARAGVSLATASRVLNDSDRRVGREHRDRVLRAARELNYRTDLSAQAMARGAPRSSPCSSAASTTPTSPPSPPAWPSRPTRTA